MQRGISYEGVYRQALVDSFAKLDPRVQWRNPVMFVVEVGTFITLLLSVDPRIFGSTGPGARPYDIVVTVILLLTLLFANFAEALAEGRGRAQAASLRRTKSDTVAHRIDESGRPMGDAAASSLRTGDLVRVAAGELVPADGEIVRGVASIDESAITGESAPVIREAGGDFSSVTGGTKVLSDWIEMRVTAEPGKSFLDRMIALVEGAERQKSPNEIALTVLLSALTLIFLIVIDSLPPMAHYLHSTLSIATLIALLVCLIPTTIGALLSAIGIAGMDRVIRFNIIAKSGRAVEAAGDVDTLILDKTGTITLGNRMADAFRPLPGVEAAQMVEASLLASYYDETPEGRSIVDLARKQGVDVAPDVLVGAAAIAFSAETRRSGIVLAGGREISKGAVDVIKRMALRGAGALPPELDAITEEIARAGGTPLAVIDQGMVLGVIHLKDIIKPGMQDRFAALRRMGIHTVMVTGDNPLTAATIAREAGVDDFIAEAKPEDKMRRIREEQSQGKLVAMTGDGTNDAPALAQADVGLAMNSGTSAAKEAGNMVDLDSDPTKLIEVVSIGKQLLITRGAITTFSIANDVAKYFAIIPAMFVATVPALQALNVMHLTSPRSAILSALIFNALIIPALIPLALRGVRYRPMNATQMLQRNMLIYGLGGVIAPFLGIKLIDLALTALGLAHI
ncbi:MAG: potassium-transporting ATPase subunit KdpB [Thermaerobacter sp.]|nr:potassium-transporting ATPase subunit KdpB [Thermaerobacter sp.]